jgi:hypothetical protein
MGSTWRFAQVFPHWVSERAQPQAPVEHTKPGMQLAPQLPQLRRSFLMSTHTPPQASCPRGHWQEPIEHTRPPVHVTPQAPQLEESTRRSMHALLHAVVGGGHARTHVPPLQTCVARHLWLQAPQF